MDSIKFDGVYKSYSNGNEENVILNDAGYSFRKECFYSIIGRSGLGKTTLLRILGTVEKPDKGDICIENYHFKNCSEKDINFIRRNKIGFIFQNFCLIDRYSIMENLQLPVCFSKKMKQSELKERIIDILGLIGIPEKKLNQTVASLSGGEKQRVAIGRAIINSPPILLADEPTGNLDAKNEGKIMDLFLEIKEKCKCTIIMVTHNRKLADRSDQIITIENGKIMSVGDEI